MRPQPSAPGLGRGRTTGLLLVLAGLLMLIYAPAVNNTLTPVDITWVKTFQDRGVTAFRWLFTVNAFEHLAGPGSVEYRYQVPGVVELFSSSYAPAVFKPGFNFYVAGTAWLFGYSAEAHRLFVIVLYYLETVLVFSVVYTLTDVWLLSALTAFLFATSPPGARPILMLYQGNEPYVFFYLLAVLLYVLARRVQPSMSRGTGPSLITGSVACTLLALFCYELSITLPFVITLIEVVQGRVLRRWPYRLQATLPYYAAGLFYLAVRVAVLAGVEKDALHWHEWYLTQFFSMYGMIQAATQFAMLFVPNFLTLRTGVKAWLFGDMPGVHVLALHRQTLVVAGSLALVGVLVLGYWFMRKPRVRAFLFSNERGHLLLFGLGWGALTILPVAHLPVTEARLILGSVGSSFVKAIALVCLADAILTRWKIPAWTPHAVLLAPLLLYNYWVVATPLNEYATCNEIRKSVLTAARSLVVEPEDPDRPVVLYLLNHTGQIGACDTGQLGWSYLLERETGRKRLAVRVPYVVAHRTIQEYQESVYPIVTRRDARTVEVTQVTQERALLTVSIPAFNTQVLGNNLLITNGDYYTVEALDVDVATKSLRHFVIQAEQDRPVVFFLNHKGHFVRLSS